jgi:hypothetical protein
MIRIITAPALLITEICCAPLTRADLGDDVYLDQIHGNYFSRMHTDSEWLSEGQRICNAHLSGSDADFDSLMQMVESDLSVPSSVAASVIGYAEGGLGC